MIRATTPSSILQTTHLNSLFCSNCHSKVSISAIEDPFHRICPNCKVEATFVNSLDPLVHGSDTSLSEVQPSDNNLVSFSDISSLGDLLDLIQLSTGDYVHKQSDSIFSPSQDFKKVGFGDIDLLKFHNEKLPLYVDKYLFTAVPDIQIEFLLESMGVPQDCYDADLDPKFKFNVNACFDNQDVNEFVTPRVRGGSFNPYVRFLSSKSSGGGQALKLFDLAGLDPNREFSVSPCFDLLTLTFPFDISVLLLNSKTRGPAIKKMFKCYRQFFKELHFLFGVPFDHTLGSSVSLHPWSTKFPLLPHAHFHAVLPHFSYKKINADQRLEYEFNIDLPDVCKYGGREFEKGRLYSRLYALVVEYELTHNKKSKRKNADVFSPPSDEAPPDGILISNPDKRQFNRFISDGYDFAQLYDDISLKLSSMLEFSVLDFELLNKVSPRGVPYTTLLPFDADLLRFIWTDIVNEVFDIDPSSDVSLDYSDPVLYDIFIEYASLQRETDSGVMVQNPMFYPKLLHFLSYKSRPAVLDLDLFFKKCSGFVLDHDHIDKDRALSYIRGLLADANNYENLRNVDKYESILSKAETIFSQFSDRIIIDWLRFLSTHRTITKTYGFWRNIKRYRVSSVKCKAIPFPKVCSICGNPTCVFRLVNSLDIDGFILHHGSKFYLFNIDKPPP